VLPVLTVCADVRGLDWEELGVRFCLEIAGDSRSVAEFVGRGGLESAEWSNANLPPENRYNMIGKNTPT
jgi:hypothetical protein